MAKTRHDTWSLAGEEFSTASVMTAMETALETAVMTPVEDKDHEDEFDQLMGKSGRADAFPPPGSDGVRVEELFPPSGPREGVGESSAYSYTYVSRQTLVKGSGGQQGTSIAASCASVPTSAAQGGAKNIFIGDDDVYQRPYSGGPYRGSGDFPGPLLSGDHQRAISLLQKRHADVDRQMAVQDSRHTEMMTIYWKLVREQTNTLASEFEIVQQQIQEMRTEFRHMRGDLDVLTRESEIKLSEESVLRGVAYRSLEDRIAKIKCDAETEIKSRMQPLMELQQRLTGFEDTAATVSNSQRFIEDEFTKWKGAIEFKLNDVGQLRAALDQESSERMRFENTSLELLGTIKDGLLKESTESAHRAQEHFDQHMQKFEEERRNREEGHDVLGEDLARLRRELREQNANTGGLIALRTRLTDIENQLTMKFKDAQKLTDREASERTSTLMKLERRLAEWQSSVDREAGERQQQLDDLDQNFKALKMKMRTVVAESVDAGKLVCEEMGARLSGLIEREASLRDAQRMDLLDQVSVHRSTLDNRMEALEEMSRSLDDRLRNGSNFSEDSPLDSALRRQMESIMRQLRDRIEQMERRVSFERELREAQTNNLEEHMAWIDHFMADARLVFMQSGPNCRQLGIRKMNQSYEASTASPPHSATRISIGSPATPITTRTTPPPSHGQQVPTSVGDTN